MKKADIPLFDCDPNDCCGDLDCELCGGRIWIGTYAHDPDTSTLTEGQEVGLYWHDKNKPVYGYTAKYAESVLVIGVVGWYAEPKDFSHSN